MKQERIEKLGFELMKKIDHDEFVTATYRNGSLEVELTYGWYGLMSWSLRADDLSGDQLNEKLLKRIAKLLVAKDEL
jgi:hypothetical protein